MSICEQTLTPIRRWVHRAFHQRLPSTHPSIQDWTRDQILLALKQRGWSLRRLSLHHGYSASALSQALARPWPKGERLIAEALGISPQNIWPHRYAKRAHTEMYQK